MTAEDDLWMIPEYLSGISHTEILTTHKRMYVDRRLYEAGTLGRVE